MSRRIDSKPTSSQICSKRLYKLTHLHPPHEAKLVELLVATFLDAFQAEGVEYAGSGVAKKLERGTSLVLHVILSILLRAALRYSTECVDTKVVLAEQDTI